MSDSRGRADGAARPLGHKVLASWAGQGGSELWRNRVDDRDPTQANAYSGQAADQPGADRLAHNLDHDAPAPPAERLERAELTSAPRHGRHGQQTGYRERGDEHQD